MLRAGVLDCGNVLKGVRDNHSLSLLHICIILLHTKLTFVKAVCFFIILVGRNANRALYLRQERV